MNLFHLTILGYPFTILTVVVWHRGCGTMGAASWVWHRGCGIDVPFISGLSDVLLVFPAPSTPTQEAHKHTEFLCLFYVHVKHSVPENKTEIVKFI